MTKTIEDQITEYYKGENGTWVVEKGKLKEAKLLKEAVVRIRALKNELRFVSDSRDDLRTKMIDKEKVLKDREVELEKRQNSLRNTMNSVHSMVSKYLENDV